MTDRVLSDQQFSELLTHHLGPEHDENHPSHEQYWGGLPPHVYRVMSDEHYQQSMRTGVHQSDERGNYIGQAKADPEGWKGMEATPEGTVAGRWAELGYSKPHQLTRVAKIKVDPSVGWKVHEDAEDMARTMHPIPAEHIEAVTPAFSRGKDFDKWKVRG